MRRHRRSEGFPLCFPSKQNQNRGGGTGDPVVKGKKSKDAPGRPIKKTFLPLHRSAMSTGVGMPSIHGPSCNTPLI